MTHETLTAFFGWFTLINYAIMVISWFIFAVMRETIVALHSRMTGVAKDELPRLYFQFYAIYKVLILTFGLTPYLVLRLVLN